MHCYGPKTAKNNSKKKTMKYLERCKEKRKDYFSKLAGHSKDNRVYLDESGINKFFYREYGWAKRGKKVVGEMAGKRYLRESFIAR